VLIRFENISIGYNEKTLLEGLTVDIAAGDKLALKGESGSGKTTLLNMVTGFVRPTAGRMLLHNEVSNQHNIRALRRRIAYLPQQINFSDYDVKDFLELPFTFSANKSIRPNREKIMKLFRFLGLKPELIDQTMQEVSGGEKQRIALVSCLLLERQILLLDEPVSALDDASKKLVMDYLFSQKKLTIISASHDAEWVARCNKVINLHQPSSWKQ
jgi:ABC-type lipoprotein export system ATPase subunit